MEAYGIHRLTATTIKRRRMYARFPVRGRFHFGGARAALPPEKKRPEISPGLLFYLRSEWS